MEQRLHEASYYEKLGGRTVQCLLCPQLCVIPTGKVGFCKVRKNIEGVLYSLIYGKTTGMALDPIEKKPLYRFHPGQMILSLGTHGCNLTCQFCQNWHISQDVDGPLEEVTIDSILMKAKHSGSFGIAYTYNEPFIGYEFVRDCSREARLHHLENVLVTNGYVNPKPLEDILPFIGAMNIDLKAFDDAFYHEVCGGRLDPVLQTIKKAKEACHIELTNLLIPTLNDSVEQVQLLTDWVYDNVGSDTPLHFTRYFPCYHMTIEPTPVATLERAAEIARRKLAYVYLGNV